MRISKNLYLFIFLQFIRFNVFSAYVVKNIKYADLSLEKQREIFQLIQEGQFDSPKEIQEKIKEKTGVTAELQFVPEDEYNIMSTKIGPNTGLGVISGELLKVHAFLSEVGHIPTMKKKYRPFKEIAQKIQADLFWVISDYHKKSEGPYPIKTDGVEDFLKMKGKESFIDEKIERMQYGGGNNREKIEEERELILREVEELTLMIEISEESKKEKEVKKELEELISNLRPEENPRKIIEKNRLSDILRDILSIHPDLKTIIDAASKTEKPAHLYLYRGTMGDKKKGVIEEEMGRLSFGKSLTGGILFDKDASAGAIGLQREILYRLEISKDDFLQLKDCIVFDPHVHSSERQIYSSGEYFHPRLRISGACAELAEKLYGEHITILKLGDKILPDKNDPEVKKLLENTVKMLKKEKEDCLRKSLGKTKDINSSAGTCHLF